MEELLKRIEAATGKDRELDADLWWALCPDDSQREFWNGATGLPKQMDHTKPMPAGLGRAGVRAMAPRFSASLDAALALAERVLPEWMRDMREIETGKWIAFVNNKNPPLRLFNAEAPTPALALLAALLRALISEAKPHD